MNKYEELVYSLIYNCNREITKEEKKILNQASAIYNTYNNLTDELGCPLEVVFKALKEENARYKVLEKELKSEINVLFSYMEFTKLFFEIFNLNYSNETFTLSLIPNEQYNIENVDLKICLIKEDADKILKVAELLEKEVLE